MIKHRTISRLATALVMSGALSMGAVALAAAALAAILNGFTTTLKS